MEDMLTKHLNDALFITRSLFNRNKASGSTANISFIFDDHIFISGTGTCFGTLSERRFSKVSRDGKNFSGPSPSKELELHRIMYNYYNDINAIIHCHSFYSTLWSCLEHDGVDDVVPSYTPYLEMKLGKVAMVPYALPGSKELFDKFKNRIHLSKGLLLQNHGVIVGGSSLMEAFYILEELEESIKIAWHLEKDEKKRRNVIKVK